MSDQAAVILDVTPPRELVLGSKLGSGGFGTVFAVEGDDSLAIKRFDLQTADAEKRLEAMLTIATASDFETDDRVRHPQLAWPLGTVRDADGRLIGYAMRRVGRPEFIAVGCLFDHAHRWRFFPEATWKSALGVARNLSSLVAGLHARGLVLGDLSDGNLVINHSGLLTFVDCDSMELTVPGSNQRFPCTVLIGMYAAPELHADASLPRTPETDAFALAVLVCRLLLLGDHPYMGIHSRGDEDATWEGNLRIGLTYLLTPAAVGLPAGTIDPNVLPPDVRALAERMFGPGHGDPGARPTAEDWVVVLDDALGHVSVCAARPRHLYGDHLAACPWCARIDGGGLDLFADPIGFPGAGKDVPEHGSVFSTVLVLIGVVFVVIVLVLLAHG